MTLHNQAPPLSGLRVLEISDSVPVAACGRQFARWGAEVIKLPPSQPQTQPHSQTQMQAQRQPISEAALLRASLDSNKQYLSGDPGSDRSFDHSSVHSSDQSSDQSSYFGPALIASSDVLITDVPPDQLPMIPPQSESLIVIDISAFGRRGAYSAYAGNTFIAEAMSGFMSVQGQQHQAPLRMPGNILAKACGVAAFNAALAAIHKRRLTGAGDYIDVSCMQVLATIVPTLRTQLDKPEQRDGGPGITPLGVRLYEFGGSYLSFNFAMKPALASLLDIIGLDDSHIPAHLAKFADRQNYQELKTFIEGLPCPFDAHDLFTIISAPPHSSAVGKVLTPLQTTKDIQL